jgi:FeS assembly protein IscX
MGSRMPVEEQDPQPIHFPSNENTTIGWEDSYEIALALRHQHPDIDLEEVSLGMIYHWTIDLPEFLDDHELANEQILLTIYQEWFEEVNSI